MAEIDARDGEIDFISCGRGNDMVKADANDMIVGGQCERIQRA